MGGVSMSQVEPFDGYSCPWCPTVVMVVDSARAAREFMESHLDGHFAQAIGRPRQDVAA